ncbi:hypothetical protein GGR50DRAFT_104 [Xylaria sp. CBS 124048]|nr:hypothetical protein GGR50DRAFT_104 [Xylaria sp. CBS 124048]
MEIRQVLRPLRSLSYATFPPATRASTAAFPSIFAGQQRYQSSTSRTKKALKIPPHPDFLTPQSGQTHIVYNPPASAPSVYHTPLKFLPKTDPRRRASLGRLVHIASSSSARSGLGHASSSASASAEQQQQSNQPQLPPVMRGYDPNFQKYTVSEEQVEEIRRLRAEDPVKWSVLALADKFNCRPVFIMKVCRASPEHREREKERLEAIEARWGPAKVRARSERKKRMELLLRGAL